MSVIDPCLPDRFVCECHSCNLVSKRLELVTLMVFVVTLEGTQSGEQSDDSGLACDLEVVDPNGKFELVTE